MVQLLDGLIAWLMRPRVRRVRRWSFVLTIPFALVVGHLVGIEQGAFVVVARVALWAAVAVLAWRLTGERGEALRDLLTHPRGRAFARAELDVMTALPRLALGRIAGGPQPGASYQRGTFGVALGLAFTPVLVAEAVAFHLLLHGGTIAWVQTGLHAYSLVWLWGFALGARAFPHRVGARGGSVLRNGPLYRVRVPPGVIAAATARTERVSRRCAEREGAVLLAARDRVDVWLELSEPVFVQRPWREPVMTTRLAVASDDPDRLVERLLAPAERRREGARPVALPLLDVAGIMRDAAQPA